MKNKKFNYIILAIFTFLVLFFLLKDNFVSITNQMFNINIFCFLMACLLMIINWLYKAIILQEIILEYKKNFSLWKSIKLHLQTLFFCAITPFSSGGQPFEAVMLKNEGISISNSTNIIIYDTICHQIAIEIVGFITIMLNIVFNYCTNSLLFILAIVGFVINLAYIFLLYFICKEKRFKSYVIKFVISILSKVKMIKDKEESIRIWKLKLDTFNDGFKKVSSNKKRFVELVFYNVISLVCQHLVPIWLIFGIGLYSSFNILSCITLSSFVYMIGMFVPIPGGTIGIEYSFVHLFGAVIGDASATSILLLWRFITYYSSMITGGILLNIKLKKNS